jgi:acyl carrier protein
VADVTLETILASVLGVEPSELNDQSNARNTRNWDSMRHIEVLLAVETAFDIRFSMPEITGMQNLGDIRRLLAEKGAAA